jgi:hypothetical protein
VARPEGWGGVAVAEPLTSAEMARTSTIAWSWPVAGVEAPVVEEDRSGRAPMVPAGRVAESRVRLASTVWRSTLSSTRPSSVSAHAAAGPELRAPVARVALQPPCIRTASGRRRVGFVGRGRRGRARCRLLRRRRWPGWLLRWWRRRRREVPHEPQREGQRGRTRWWRGWIGVRESCFDERELGERCRQRQ